MKDDTEAIKWYRKAADQGDVVAESNLGFMFENGNGVAKDDVEALKWYQKAAAQGEAVAQYNLGARYEAGHGVPKDEVESYKWYLLAGAQGNVTAKKNSSALERLLKPEQRAEGQRLAREFKPRVATPASPAGPR